jgi:hypothetical protein
MTKAVKTAHISIASGSLLIAKRLAAGGSSCAIISEAALSGSPAARELENRIGTGGVHTPFTQAR